MASFDRRPRFGSSLLILAALLGYTDCIKECVQPVRLSVYDPPCDEASVPATIYARRPGNMITISSGDINKVSLKREECKNDQEPPSHFCDYGPCETTDPTYATRKDVLRQFSIHNGGFDACSMAVTAIYSERLIDDVALFHSGMCRPHEDIRKGTFTVQDALSLLPYNNELVKVFLTGRDLRRVIERAMHIYHEDGNAGAFPLTAGMKFDLVEVETNRPQLPRQRVTNVHILDKYCQWDPLEKEKIYSVLTNRFLASGGDGYSILRDHRQRNGTILALKRSEVDKFWFHVHATCSVKIPTYWNRLEDQNAMSFKNSKLVYQSATHHLQNETAQLMYLKVVPRPV